MTFAPGETPTDPDLCLSLRSLNRTMAPLTDQPWTEGPDQDPEPWRTQGLTTVP
jgi:hypothetical protein